MPDNFFQISLGNMTASDLDFLDTFFRSALRSLSANASNYMESVTAMGECIQAIAVAQTALKTGPYESFTPVSDMATPISINGVMVDASDFEATKQRLAEIRQEQTGGESE
tara:strand:- start:183 stop:515 length:333 start_codon:yes stop_codon:yes gene_type:complete